MLHDTLLMASGFLLGVALTLKFQDMMAAKRRFDLSRINKDLKEVLEDLKKKDKE